MGKTVPSYRMALEEEIDRWKGFQKALPNEEEQEAFEELMDMCRNYAMAGSCATNPIIFELIVMSILLAQCNKLRELEYKLNEVLWQNIAAKSIILSMENPRVEVTASQVKSAGGE